MYSFPVLILCELNKSLLVKPRSHHSMSLYMSFCLYHAQYPVESYTLLSIPLFHSILCKIFRLMDKSNLTPLASLSYGHLRVSHGHSSLFSQFVSHISDCLMILFPFSYDLPLTETIHHLIENLNLVSQMRGQRSEHSASTPQSLCTVLEHSGDHLPMSAGCSLLTAVWLIIVDVICCPDSSLVFCLNKSR